MRHLSSIVVTSSQPCTDQDLKKKKNSFCAYDSKLVKIDSKTMGGFYDFSAINYLILFGSLFGSLRDVLTARNDHAEHSSDLVNMNKLAHDWVRSVQPDVLMVIRMILSSAEAWAT